MSKPVTRVVSLLLMMIFMVCFIPAAFAETSDPPQSQEQDVIPLAATPSDVYDLGISLSVIKVGSSAVAQGTSSLPAGKLSDIVTYRVKLFNKGNKPVISRLAFAIPVGIEMTTETRNLVVNTNKSDTFEIEFKAPIQPDKSEEFDMSFKVISTETEAVAELKVNILTVIDSETNLCMEDNDLTNNSASARLQIRNPLKDAVLKKVEAKTGKKLTGAVIEIKNSKQETVFTGTSDNDGVFNVTGLKPDTYTVKETKPPKGYQLSTTTWTFKVDDNGNITGETEYANEPVSVTIIKKDAKTGDKLAGANIQITDKSGKEVFKGETDAKGEITALYLEPGTYQFKELKPPSGYALNKTVFNFTVSEDGKVTGDLTITNSTNEVVITKTDASGQKVLQGATIEVKDSAGKVVATGITNEKGQITFGKLAVGKYSFKETLAPAGYALNPLVYGFELHDDGTITGDTKMTNNPIIVTIKKINAKTGKGLAGAIFGLYNSSNVLLLTGTSNTDGVLQFEQLAPGSYTIRETQAPDGYQLSGKSISIEISPTYVNADAYTVENSPVVQTGVDGIPPALYIILTCALLGAAATTYLLLRKRHVKAQ